MVDVFSAIFFCARILGKTFTTNTLTHTHEKYNKNKCGRIYTCVGLLVMELLRLVEHKLAINPAKKSFFSFLLRYFICEKHCK